MACSGSDASKAVPEAGGAGGEGGDSVAAGGSNANAGSKNSGGSLGVVGGQGGDSSLGGAPVVGQGGAQGGQDSGMLGGAGSDSAGAGGAGGETAVDMSLPAACPGVLGDYTLKVGTENADHYLVAALDGKQLVFGLGGDDVFDYDYAGQDCLLGGPGDDEFTSSGEFASYFFGGPGADVFHLTNAYGYFNVADMEAGDTITLSQTPFNFLIGQSGSTPDPTAVVSVPGYATGSASAPNGEGGVLIYDPNDGSLWRDTDRGDKTTGANKVGTILNYSTYTFDINDFEIE